MRCNTPRLVCEADRERVRWCLPGLGVFREPVRERKGTKVADAAAQPRFSAAARLDVPRDKERAVDDIAAVR